MNNYLCLIILFFSVNCYGHEKQQERKTFGQYRHDRNDYQLKDDEYFDKDDYLNHYYDKEFVGNPDFDAKIERPCLVFDLNCIRRYFSKNFRCKIRRGPLPRNLFTAQKSLYFSRVNLTAGPNNVGFRGLRNTRIEEFYINRRTNNMVFAIQLRGLTISIPTNYFQFYRTGREPVVIVTEVEVLFPLVTITAIIPIKDDLLLEKVELTGYIDVLPIFTLGPEFLNNTDPTVTQSLLEFVADVPTDAQEVMLTDAFMYPPAYIQYNICDFDLPVLLVDVN